MTRILPSWKLLPAFACLVAGCAGTPQSTGPAPSQEAAALQTLERSSATATNAVAAIDQAREVVLNNLRNAHMMAFKGSMAFLQEGGKVHVQPDYSQGPLETTGQDLDLTINGTGFFMIKLSGEAGIGFTRMGSFFTDETGQLRLNVAEDGTLDPPINVPLNATKITIGSDGRVMAQVSGNPILQAIGQIQIARFANPAGLKPDDGGIFVATLASGPAILNNPGLDGLGTLTQGALESSNVDLARETLRLEILDQWRAALLRAMKIPG